MKFPPSLLTFLKTPIFSVITILFVICTTIVLAEAFLPNDRQIKNIGAEYGKQAAKRIRQWSRLINTAQHVSERKKLDLVNRFFNKVRFISDRKHWSREDYWATPIEFLITNGGDCEDFSIAKYFTLRAVGVDASKLRMIYVKATNPNQAHMILAYYSAPGKVPLILDNLVKEILPGTKRRDLVPVYSFNGDYLWLAKELKGRGEMVGSATRISLWNKVQRKMRKEKQKFVARER